MSLDSVVWSGGRARPLRSQELVCTISFCCTLYRVHIGTPPRRLCGHVREVRCVHAKKTPFFRVGEIDGTRRVSTGRLHTHKAHSAVVLLLGHMHLVVRAAGDARTVLRHPRGLRRRHHTIPDLRCLHTRTPPVRMAIGGRPAQRQGVPHRAHAVLVRGGADRVRDTPAGERGRIGGTRLDGCPAVTLAQAAGGTIDPLIRAALAAACASQLHKRRHRRRRGRWRARRRW